MFGWKAKKAIEEPSWEQPEAIEEEELLPTWSDGSYGPAVPASRIYGRLRGDAEHEARLAAAE